MLSFDLTHYRSQDNPDRKWVARYRIEGNTIKIVWQNLFGDPANPDVVERNETSAHPAFEAGPQAFIPMCHCMGKRLSGIYRLGPPGLDQSSSSFPTAPCLIIV